MTTMTQTKSKTYDLGPLTQIPLGEGRRMKIGHVPVAIFRPRDGGVFATQALCPHRAGPLSDGIIGGGQLHCPLHAYRFDIATGEPLGNECKALKTYPVAVTDDDRIHITLETRAKTGDGK